MRHVKLLDTTLRDGGRIIDCKFPDEHIRGIAQGLTAAGVDIIEMGFLRGNADYKGNSTFFSEFCQVENFIPEDKRHSMFVLFADYGQEFGMWDFTKLPECDGKTITGIRVGYRKKDLLNARELFHIVKDKGYKLFIQGVESLNYSDKEMLEALEIINEEEPDCFGIVDTYGAMYKDDVLRIFSLVHNNLKEDISIDFHSHNNLQLSFSFAQEIVEAAAGKREVVIDATMEGVGKGIGNLNTELIMDYLNRKWSYNYDIDSLFDTIDEYLTWIKKKESWAYQIPYFMAGIYSSHVNNIIYLMDKHKLSTKDIRHILSMIDPNTRKRYDYENIENLYIEYCQSKVADDGAIKMLREELGNKHIVVLVPGSQLTKYNKMVHKFIEEKHPIVISVNFSSEYSDYAFFGNPRRYMRCVKTLKKKTILTSNIKAQRQDDIVINFNSLINRGVKYFDNSTIMLLNLLRNIGVSQISLAGFDGFDVKNENNYLEENYNVTVAPEEFDTLNEDISKLLRNYAKTVKSSIEVQFITPSLFSTIFP